MRTGTHGSLRASTRPYTMCGPPRSEVRRLGFGDDVRSLSSASLPPSGTPASRCPHSPIVLAVPCPTGFRAPCLVRRFSTSVPDLLGSGRGSSIMRAPRTIIGHQRERAFHLPLGARGAEAARTAGTGGDPLPTTPPFRDLLQRRPGGDRRPQSGGRRRRTPLLPSSSGTGGVGLGRPTPRSRRRPPRSPIALLSGPRGHLLRGGPLFGEQPATLAPVVERRLVVVLLLLHEATELGRDHWQRQPSLPARPGPKSAPGGGLVAPYSPSSRLWNRC
jgi:hypothetical protein